METKQYLNSLTFQDYFITIVISVVNLLGAIYLLLLNKISFYLFCGSLIINTFSSILHAINKGFLKALSGGGLIGVLIGYGILIGVCLYSRYLMKSNVLN